MICVYGEHDDYIVVTIYILTICNLKCDYCFVRRGTNNNQIMKFDDIIKIKEYADELAKHRNIEVHIMGGEPTLHPKLPNIINLFKNYKIVLFTNGTKKLVPYNNVYYYVSFHGEDNDIQKILDNIKNIEKDSVHLRVMFTAEDVEKRVHQADVFSSYEYSVDLCVVDDDMAAYSKLPDKYITTSSGKDTYILNIDGKIIIINEAQLKQFDVSGFKCEIGKYEIFPDMTGNVNCCGSNDILKEMKSNREFIICPKKQCSYCFFDYKKWKE